ncbi:MAG: DNA helicase [Halomonas sp. 54_146]|nr:hypothetical protein [Halomonas sp. 54_146]KUJ86281.1 MAG: DNA helicase [Halomonas sp. 54_146]
MYDHLSGKQVAGLYPLLPDSSCYLLAVDFDKENWKADVLALAQACRDEDIPYLVEIYRSGAGAHLWIFFSEAVPAWSARTLGFKLLDKAMNLHPGLSFNSYDRLFPNQDTMPAGGFGNLIALPLQYQARNRGCTVFVDDDLIPYPDQWALLSRQESLSPVQLGEKIGKEADSDANADVTMPWEQALPVETEKIIGCPETITLIYRSTQAGSTEQLKANRKSLSMTTLILDCQCLNACSGNAKKATKPWGTSLPLQGKPSCFRH